MSRLVLFVSLLTACGGGTTPAADAHPDGDGHADALDDRPCTDGETRCTGNDLETCSAGVYVLTQSCGSLVCDASLGCVTCAPNIGTCSGEVSTYCLEDGTGYAVETCDPVQGLECSPSTGRCTGACAAINIADSYIGCDYYPTILPNAVEEDFDFAVTISNDSGGTANVTLEGGALTSPIEIAVPDGSVHVERLPWVMSLFECGEDVADHRSCDAGVRANDGAYRLRSTRPVTVFQFSPLDYGDGEGNFSYTNDASLLLPVTVWGDEYVVAAYATQGGGGEPLRPSLFTVTAASDATTLTVQTTASTDVGSEGAFLADASRSFSLDGGDVLVFIALSGDLSGSWITSDKPVQVIGGHFCAHVPTGIPSCDHMEESLIPISALGTDVLVTPPEGPEDPGAREQVIRIIATAPNTQLTFDPSLEGAPTTLADPGDFAEIEGEARSFFVRADKKILVAQYMEGRSVTGDDAGDPSLTLAVPVEQYRMSYLFHAPTNYERNFVGITAPTGATVRIDGVDVTDFEAIGTSGYGTARVELSAGDSGGNHSATGTSPFGVTVYGYGFATSYWYPGGLDVGEVILQ